MHSTVLSLGFGGFMTIAGLAIGSGGADLYQSINSPSEVYSMHLEKLQIKDGKIGQSIQVVGVEIIRAEWSAEITRNGNNICSGGGIAPYEQRLSGSVDWYSPNDWTGGTCPELRNGDVARAVWTYKTLEGYTASISGELKIKVK